MQKQFRNLDEQLQLNHFVRIVDPIPKPANSFFRALSISLFSTHNQTEYVKSIMKLTLLANCQAYQNNLLKHNKKYHIAFPIISESSELVKKFINDKEMLEMYTQYPDSQCFQNDNYELAAFTFNRRVSVYYLNKEGYLNETLISCCRNKTGRKIHLSKVGKRFFAVQKQSIKSITSYIREYLLGSLISQIVLEKSDKENTKVHFSALDERVMSSHNKYPKIHKKSLSECGDIINKLDEFKSGYVEMQKNFHTNIKNNYDQIENRSHQQEPKNLIERDLDFSDKDNIEIVPQPIEIKHEETNQNGQEKPLESDQSQMQVKVQTQSSQKIQEQTEAVDPTQQQPKTQPAQFNYDAQQYSQEYKSQMQAYYQNPYMYSNYQSYDSQNYYANYYNMQQQMIYDPHYYSYYQQHQHQPQPQSQEAYPYPHAQQNYTYTHHQQLVNNKRYTGRLKFYDTNGKYGFIIVDGIGSDLFVHYDDLSKAGMTKQHLEIHSASRQLRFEFTYYQYEGRNKKAKKAIDLLLLNEL